MSRNLSAYLFGGSRELEHVASTLEGMLDEDSRNAFRVVSRTRALPRLSELPEHVIPSNRSARKFRSEALWVPANGEQEGIAVLQNCDINTRIRSWTRRFPYSLCQTMIWGCSINALAFLDVLTHGSALRRIDLVQMSQESGDPARVAHGSLPIRILLQWFNHHGASRGLTYTAHRVQILERDDLDRFYQMLRTELPPNSCTILFNERRLIKGSDHYNVVSRTSDGEIVIFEPLLGNRYVIRDKVSERYWMLNFKPHYSSIVLVWARGRAIAAIEREEPEEEEEELGGRRRHRAGDDTEGIVARRLFE